MRHNDISNFFIDGNLTGACHNFLPTVEQIVNVCLGLEKFSGVDRHNDYFAGIIGILRM